MLIAGIALAVAGFLALFVASAARSCLPALILDEGRDPSERREAAAERLRYIWVMRITALLAIGAGAALLSIEQAVVSPWIAAGVLSVITLLLGALLPAWLGHRRPDRIGRAIEPAYVALRLLFWLPALPLRLLNGADHQHTGEWLVTPPSLMWLEQRMEKGDREEYDKEQELIDSILDFSDKIVREVMVPRIDMVTIEESEDLADIVSRVEEAGHSRIPVYREKVDSVVGVLYVKDLLPVLTGQEDFRIGDLLREAYFVPEYKRIDDLFKEFQYHRIHMAVVVDEYGGTAGLVTIEDIIEEVFGEILDEYDSEAPLIRSMGRGGYRVDARLPVDDLNDLLGTDFEDDDYETLGGMVYGTLEHIPRAGESVELDGWRFSVEKVRAQRILLLKVTPLSRPPEERNT